MTTQQVADKFMELANQGKFNEIQDELFADNCESIEPAHSQEQGLTHAKGIEAIRAKGKTFNESVEEVHSGYTGTPNVAGNHFSVTMGMDVTMKGAARMKMDEICVYEVKDGKIVKEQFFY